MLWRVRMLQAVLDLVLQSSHPALQKAAAWHAALGVDVRGIYEDEKSEPQSQAWEVERQGQDG